jgi:hypothetical protein
MAQSYGSVSHPYPESIFERIVEVGWSSAPVAILYCDTGANSVEVLWTSDLHPNPGFPPGYSPAFSLPTDGRFSAPGEHIPKQNDNYPVPDNNNPGWTQNALCDTDWNYFYEGLDVYPSTRITDYFVGNRFLQPGPPPPETGAGMMFQVGYVIGLDFRVEDVGTVYEVTVEGSIPVPHYILFTHDMAPGYPKYEPGSWLDYTDGRGGRSFGSGTGGGYNGYRAYILQDPNVDGIVSVFDLHEFEPHTDFGTMTFAHVDNYHDQTPQSPPRFSHPGNEAWIQFNICDDAQMTLWDVPFGHHTEPGLKTSRDVFLMNFGYKKQEPPADFLPDTADAVAKIFQAGNNALPPHDTESFANTYRLVIFPGTVELFSGPDQTIVAKDKDGHTVAPVYDESRSLDWKSNSSPIGGQPQLRFNKSGWV